MRAIAKFEKVSTEQYAKDVSAENTLRITEEYNDIKLPARATSGSAGYDFYAPRDITVGPGKTVKVATGIKVRMEEDYCLMIFPRSGLGFKYRMQLDNTVGIIDSDYYNNESNEGHIFIKITNDSREEKTIFVEKGKGFAQGIFVPFGVTEDDSAPGTRTGGIGSSDGSGESRLR